MRSLQGWKRWTAVSVVLGLSIVYLIGCRNSRSSREASQQSVAQQPMYAPGAAAGVEAEIPPEPVPAAEFSAPYARAKSLPFQRGPKTEVAQEPPAVKPVERRNPLSRTVSRLLGRDEKPAEPAGQVRVTDPEPDPDPYTNTYPTANNNFQDNTPPPAPALTGEQLMETIDDIPTLALPKENIRGDIEMPFLDETIGEDDEDMLLPEYQNNSGSDLYSPGSFHQQNQPRQQPRQNQFNEDDEFSRGGPQLFSPQESGSAEQVQYLAAAEEEPAPLEIGNLSFCSLVRSFEDYEEIDATALRRGDYIIVYNTLQNFRSVASPTGYHTLTCSKVEWLGAEDRLMDQVQLERVPDASRSQRRDYYLAHRVIIPDSLPAGSYKVRLTVEDLFSGEIAQATKTIQVVD